MKRTFQKKFDDTFGMETTYIWVTLITTYVNSGMMMMICVRILYKLGQALWARSNFGILYAAVGVVKMLHTDNKQKIRKLIQSPSKRRSYVTPGGLYHTPKLERAHKAWPNLFSI